MSSEYVSCDSCGKPAEYTVSIPTKRYGTVYYDWCGMEECKSDLEAQEEPPDMKTCDSCGEEAQRRLHIPPTQGPCGDSFCYASCNLAACRGRDYDWCGWRSCEQRLRSRTTPPTKETTMSPDEMRAGVEAAHLRATIEAAKKKFLEQGTEALNKAKQHISEALRKAAEKGETSISLSQLADNLNPAMTKTLVQWLEAAGVTATTVSPGPRDDVYWRLTF